MTAEITNAISTRLSTALGTSDLNHKRIILLNPDAGSLALRGWPLESWKLLARQLENEFPDCFTVIVGLEQYKATSVEIANSTQKKAVFDFCGQTLSLSELTALMSISALLITCDSGPAHFASLVDLPTIAMFGPETPELYKPLGTNVHVIFQGLSCSPCYSAYNHRQSACRDNVCLKSISVKQVMEVVRTVLNKQKTPD